MEQAQQVLLAELKVLQAENASIKPNLDRLEKILQAQKRKSQLCAAFAKSCPAQSKFGQVETTVGDLYIIERARLASQVLSPKTDVVIE